MKYWKQALLQTIHIAAKGAAYTCQAVSSFALARSIDTAEEMSPEDNRAVDAALADFIRKSADWN